MNNYTDSSVSASIVIYRTPAAEIGPLVQALRAGGVSTVFVVDNTPGHRPVPAGLPQGVVYELVGENVGYGRGHNLAIRRATGTHKYHLICNPDITALPGTVDVLRDFMEANPDVGVSMPKLIGPDGDVQYCCRRSPLLLDYLAQLVSPGGWGRARRDSLEMRGRDYNATMEVPCLSGCFMFFRSEVLARIGGFDERFFLYFEDFDLSLRASKVARNVYVPSTHVVHQRQSAHRHSWRLRMVFAVSAMKYFSKWGWFSSRAPQVQGL